MNDIFVYLVEIPRGVNEIVLPCPDGYTVYIDERLDGQGRLRAYRHAIKHIMCRDFDDYDGSVQDIESRAHGKGVFYGDLSAG